MKRAPIVTFTSDFGNREYYVGAVKGVISEQCPGAQVIDITHEIRSHDIWEAAFVLASAYAEFPARTVHLAVVDPGVGSARRGIAASTEAHSFVAPDNGLLSLIFEREPVRRVVSIEAEHYYRRPVAPTFHGRDIFAPIAARLAGGLSLSRIGPEIDDYVQLNLPPVRKTGSSVLEGVVVHIDKFGNVITSLRPEHVEEHYGEEFSPRLFRIQETQVDRHCRFYAEGGADGVFSLIGSSGYYEIAALKKPAAGLIKARRGMKVALEVGPAPAATGAPPPPDRGRP